MRSTTKLAVDQSELAQQVSAEFFQANDEMERLRKLFHKLRTAPLPAACGHSGWPISLFTRNAVFGASP
eukprot:11301547-Alexandrium_andersonii.AAC.1